MFRLVKTNGRHQQAIFEDGTENIKSTIETINYFRTNISILAIFMAKYPASI